MVRAVTTWQQRVNFLWNPRNVSSPCNESKKKKNKVCGPLSDATCSTCALSTPTDFFRPDRWPSVTSVSPLAWLLSIMLADWFRCFKRACGLRSSVGHFFFFVSCRFRLRTISPNACFVAWMAGMCSWIHVKGLECARLLLPRGLSGDASMGIQTKEPNTPKSLSCLPGTFPELVKLPICCIVPGPFFVAFFSDSDEADEADLLINW